MGCAGCEVVVVVVVVDGLGVFFSESFDPVPVPWRLKS